MNVLRKRAQQQFPTVLLTLLSIVQALALELLWEHFRQADYLRVFGWPAFIAWLQIAATLLGIVLIWVAYASNAMRFRWTPTTTDSVYPFIIGLLEFIQIETMGPNMMGQWIMLTAIIFATMVFVSHRIMKRARQSGNNGDFFSGVTPATLNDFYPQIIAIFLLLAGGAMVWVTSDTGLLAGSFIVAVLSLLIWQYFSAAKFWNSSLEN